MQEAAWPLASWEVFYRIVGSSAAALTGLQFVVIVLGADPSAAIGLGVFGIAGVVYGARVVRQARRQTIYVPDVEDWTWHGALPLVAYMALLGAAIAFSRRPASSLFVIGAATVLLLSIGIHKAWDAVIYIARDRMQEQQESGRTQPAAAKDVAS